MRHSVYLEYVSGGSIHKLLQEYGPFEEAVLRSYTAQILSGHLHGRNTVHRYLPVIFFPLSNKGPKNLQTFDFSIC